MIVDAHQHFWKVSRGDYFWMNDSVEAIRRDFLPPDLTRPAKACRVGATIAVQAAPTVAETEFLLGLADGHDLIQGVVGWVDLESDKASDDLRRLAANSKFKGIRPMLQDIEDTEWILKPAVLANLARLADIGLSLDALVQPRHLDAINRVAKALPDLRLVIDHCAKPHIRQGSDAGFKWRHEMAVLAEHSQITCKVSGLANEHGDGWSTEVLQPVFDHVVAHFGTGRLMWGSDWPVLKLAGTYEDWFDCAHRLTSGLTDDQRGAIFGGNASKFYNLSPTT